MTSNREEGFWRRLIARIGPERARRLTLEEAERKLEREEDMSLSEETIEKIVRSVTDGTSPLREHDGADYEPIVFARNYGVSRVICVLFGVLLMMSAGFVTVASLWPENQNSAWTMEFPAAIYIYCDAGELPLRRGNAQSRIIKFTLEGVRVVQALRDDPEFGESARGHLASFQAGLDEPAAITPQPFRGQFRDLARFVLDPVNDVDGRRDALARIASQTLSGISALCKPPSGDLPDESSGAEAPLSVGMVRAEQKLRTLLGR